MDILGPKAAKKFKELEKELAKKKKKEVKK